MQYDIDGRSSGRYCVHEYSPQMKCGRSIALSTVGISEYVVDTGLTIVCAVVIPLGVVL